MNIKYLIKGIIGMYFLFIFIGCEDEVLDKSPKTVLTENELWNDKNLMEKYLYSTYNALPTVWGISYYNTAAWTGGIAMLVNVSDEGFDQYNADNLWLMNQGNISSDNLGPWTKQWAGNYSSIKNCNIFLERVDESAVVDEKTRSLWKGEVKFLRAYCYAYLIDYWGGVPIITKAFGLNDDFKVPRNSYEECVDFIIKELNEAQAMVPEDWSTAYWGRITKGACSALKSRVLLRAASKLHDPNTNPNGKLYDYGKETKWQDAADAAKAVIDMPQYSLTTVNTWEDYKKIFTELNSEIILATPRTSQYNAYGPYYALYIDLMNVPNGYPGGWSTNCPTQNMVDAFQMNNGKNINDSGSDYINSVEGIYENRELRFYANIIYNDAELLGRKLQYFQPGGKDSKDFRNYGKTGYNMRKFMDESHVPSFAMNGNQPRIHFRLAEIYLNYAEAEYRLGHEDVAREYVNKIRKRVHLPEITTSGVELFKDIMHERRIELCFEDQRYFDVRRWMIADQTENEDAYGIEWGKYDANGNLSVDGTLKYTISLVQERNFSNKLYYLPISLSEIQKTDLEQNSGY